MTPRCDDAMFRARGECVAAGGLTGFGATQFEDMPACRLVTKIVVECEYAVDLGAGQVQCGRDHGDRRFRHVAECFLQRVQDYQRGTFEMRVLRDDLSAARGIPWLVDGHIRALCQWPVAELMRIGNRAKDQ